MNDAFSGFQHFPCVGIGLADGPPVEFDKPLEALLGDEVVEGLLPSHGFQEFIDADFRVEWKPPKPKLPSTRWYPST